MTWGTKWRCGIAVALLAGCIGGGLRPGVVIPARKLPTNDAALAAMIRGDLAAGRVKRAFFALEARKTRPYAGARFAAGKHKGTLGDLRPLFASMFGAPDTMVASRGLRIATGAPAPAAQADRTAEADALYWQHLRAVDRKYAHLVEGYGWLVRNMFATVSSMEAAVLFGPDEVFVSYFATGDEVHAFIVRDGALTSHRLPASRADIDAAAATLLAALSVPPPAPADRSWEAPAAALHAMVLGPLPEVAGAKVLYVSTDGAFANVPVDVLIDASGQPLIARARVTYLQSATVYRYLLQKRVLEVSPRFLAVGNPIYPAGVPDLPEAAREAETLALVFDGGKALIGAAATEQAVLDEMAERNILHFATHGVLLGRELPGASSIMLTASDGRDGFLSAAELSNIDLKHTYLAVLSACQTSVGSGKGDAGDLSSIAGAFMIAGVPTVVGSLWNVSDSSTTRLMLAFYSEFLTAGSGEALARAKRLLRATPAYQHPYYWAAFSLYGWDK